jgi:hypothetical protein
MFFLNGMGNINMALAEVKSCSQDFYQSGRGDRVWVIRIETTTHRVTTMLGDLRYDAQLIPERVLTKTMVQVC